MWFSYEGELPKLTVIVLIFCSKAGIYLLVALNVFFMCQSYFISEKKSEEQLLCYQLLSQCLVYQCFIQPLFWNVSTYYQFCSPLHCWLLTFLEQNIFHTKSVVCFSQVYIFLKNVCWKFVGHQSLNEGCHLYHIFTSISSKVSNQDVLSVCKLVLPFFKCIMQGGLIT